MNKNFFYCCIFVLSGTLFGRVGFWDPSLANALAQTPPSSSLPEEVGKSLMLREQGSWQLFALPKSWLSRYWVEPQAKQAYIILRGPAVSDLSVDFAPCWSPSRLLFGVIGHDDSVTEKLLECVNFCDFSKTDSQELWGSQTHLQGITVRVLKDGQLEIHKHFRKRAFVPPGSALKESELGVQYEDQKTIRVVRYSVKQIGGLNASNNSCVSEP